MVGRQLNSFALSGSSIFAHDSSSIGRWDSHPEIVMRGGFPMMNPKVKPHERVDDHSRLFGKNLPSVRPSASQAACIL